MITHIVFNKADAKSIESAIALDQGLEGTVVSLNDDYSLGPIGDENLQSVDNSRALWWHEVLSGIDDKDGAEKEISDDENILNGLVELLNANDQNEMWIWMAPNSRDLCGYYRLLLRFQTFEGRIMILSLNNLPFFNDKGGIFYPNFIHEIPATEFLKARKLARPVTASEFEIDTDEWRKIVQRGAGIRLYEGGKKPGLSDYDHFDVELKKYISPNWQKASRIVQQFLSKTNDVKNEIFLLWRLKQIISSEEFDVQGNQDRMRDVEMKRKVKAAVQGEEN